MILLILYMFLIFITIVVLKEKKYQYFPLYLLIITTLVVAFRGNYGYDYKNYQVIFNEIRSFSNVINTIFEKGFAFLIYFFNLLRLPFSFFIIVIAVVSMSLKYFVYKKLSPIPIISWYLMVSIYMIFNDMEQIRHGLAISICMFSILYLMDGRKLYFILLVLLATSFHYTAIVFMAGLFIDKFKLNRKTILLIVLSAVVLSFIDYYSIVNYLNDSTFKIGYITNKLDLYEKSVTSPFSFTNFYKILFILYYYNIVCQNRPSKKSHYLINMYLIGIVLSITFVNVEILSSRTSNYFRFLDTIMFADILYELLANANFKSKYFNKTMLISLKNLNSIDINNISKYGFVLFVLIYSVLKFLLVIRNPIYFHYWI